MTITRDPLSIESHGKVIPFEYYKVPPRLSISKDGNYMFFGIDTTAYAYDIDLKQVVSSYAIQDDRF